jgi:hypothetical protein
MGRMLGLFVMGLIGVLGLVFVVLLALFLARVFVGLIPIALVAVFLWTGIRWLVGLGWFIVMGVVSVLHTLWHLLV